MKWTSRLSRSTGEVRITIPGKRSATQRVSVIGVRLSRGDVGPPWEMNFYAGLALPTPEQRIVTEAVMTADRRPLPDDLNALKEIIDGRPADPQTMQRLITSNLVEEFNGTALLTTRGIEPVPVV
jgi:hypothetical protein